MKEISIIGGGFTGLTAALSLAKKGFDITIYEKDSNLGGLAGYFEIDDNIFLEKFYHHWFSSDTEIQNLCKDLGLEKEIRFINSKNSIYFTKKTYSLSNPIDLLKFKPLPFLSRIKTASMALRARSIKNWQNLENITAKEWIIKNSDIKSFEVMWEPLLKGKFGNYADRISAVWFWNKLKLRGSSRDKKGKEQLVYLNGGFKVLIDKIESELLKLNVKIKKKCEVKKISIDNNSLTKILTIEGEFKTKYALVTTSLPILLAMCPDLPASYKDKSMQIPYLGNMCLILKLSKPLTSSYWLNVADPSFPFVGVIEHTNFDNKENYNNHHIIYLSKYIDTNNPLFSLPKKEYLDYCILNLKKIIPEFNVSWIIDTYLWKEHYSQPVIVKNYSSLIPSHDTGIEGLWVSTMAQIYPEDRGTNYAVREGKRVAELIYLHNQQYE